MKSLIKLVSVGIFAVVFTQSLISVTMRFSSGSPAFLHALAVIPQSSALQGHAVCPANTDPSLDWFAPPTTNLNDIDKVFASKGPPNDDFIFDTSDGDPNTYNFCNMPRVNPHTYPRADKAYKLEYVEIIMRHHKRTPYAANLFPGEAAEWLCDDEQIYYGGEPTGGTMEKTAHTYWSTYTTNSNPLSIGYNATCQFPQISAPGLMDSYNHGADSREVYIETLEFLPPEQYLRRSNVYRVTTNPITSQVASRFILGIWHGREALRADVPLLVQPRSVDSLEPSYPCPAATTLFASYGPGSDSERWKAHLSRSADLKKRLDGITGVDPTDMQWENSWDHYFDNFAARLCHQKPLPCNAQNSSDCITREEANTVFRLGEYEYSFIYRDSEESLRASVASYGIYMGELVQNLRSHMTEEDSATESATTSAVVMRHNTAHDGSIARILSILQVNQMVWPGMGAELAFELYSTSSPIERGMKCFHLRVLWSGQIIRSSHPALGRMDMIPVGTFFAYIDGLVGVKGSKIPAMCSGEL